MNTKIRNEDREMDTRTRMDIALELQMKGRWIFPQHSIVDGKCTCNGTPECNPAKHPCERRGWNTKRIDARTSWEKFPHANIAMRTGEVSHVWALDIDGETGIESLRLLEENYGELPETLTSITGGNGKHIFFRHPGTLIKLSKTKSEKMLGKGIEVKCDGPADCVTLPPSVHHTGKIYEYVNPETPIAEAPLWLLSLLTTVDVKPAKKNDSDDITQGSRNDSMYGIVGELFRELVRTVPATPQQEADVLQRALEINRQRCKPPLDEAIIRSMVARTALTHNPSHKSSKPLSTENPLIWYRFNTLEFLESQEGLSDYQDGWRIRLLSYAWRKRGYLTADLDVLYKLASPSCPKPKFKKEIRKVLFDFSEVTENGQAYLVSFEMVKRHVEGMETYGKKVKAGQARQQARKLEIKPTANESTPEERTVIQ